jgi:hypothetical protein
MASHCWQNVTSGLWRWAYSKAARAMYAKYMSPQFDKLVKDPNLVADVVEKILWTKRPKSVYLVSLMARISLVLTSIMATDRAS